MKQSIILGCSHAAGSELSDSLEYCVSNSYPSILSDRLGYQPINYAIPGGSNDAMFRIFETKFDKLTEDNIVIACWTGYTRTEIWNEDNKTWLSIAPGGTSSKSKMHIKYAHDWIIFHGEDQAGRLNKMKNILALNSLAQSKQIKVYNIDSFWPVYEFNWPSNVIWPVPTNFWDWCNENNHSRTENGHFSLSAHAKFADYIFNNIGP